MGWETLLGCVITLLQILDSRKEPEHDRVTAALNALSDAFYSTVSYYESLHETDFLKRQKQIELANKWDVVANLTRPFDLNLSSRFSLKSRFWYEGEAWTEEEIAGANIGLEKIRRDARFKLISKQKKG